MNTLNFSEFDSNLKQAVFWLSYEAQAPTSAILSAAAHIGELWEAKAFLMHFPKGTTEHDQLVIRLRLGAAIAENILDCIQRTAPFYVTVGECCTDELADRLLASESDSERP